MKRAELSIARFHLTVGSIRQGRGWGWTALLLSALAVTADWYAPPIFVGHSLVLGIVFYWVALHMIGPDRALLVLIASTAALILKWGQPYSAAIVACEGLSVGLAWRRQRNPFLADLLYWACIGTPISWFLYANVYVIPHPSFEYAIAVQPVNGLIAVWVSFLLLEQLVASGFVARSTPAQSFHRVLLKRYVAFGSLPVLLVGLLAARTLEEQILLEARENLKSQTLRVAALISRQLADGKANLRELAAQQSDRAWFFDSARLTRELAALHAQSGMFVTMLAADSVGKIVAVAPIARVTAGPSPLVLPLVADREYFGVPMKTGRSHVSTAFRGRGFGQDVLVAVSAPVLAHTGERMGVIEGSIKVSTFEAILRENFSGDAWRALLSDRQLRVIAAKGFEYSPLNDLDDTAIETVIQRRGANPVRLTLDFNNQRTSFLSVTIAVPDLDWTLTVQREWADVVHPVVTVYVWTLVVALATAVIASFFATWSIRDFLRAWRNLIEFSQAPSSQSALLEKSAQLDLPREFYDLLRNLEDMAQRLESAQRTRDQLLVELESKVKERTLELEGALLLAQAADRAKSVFLANVSHEFRTPLTSIFTGISILKKSGTCSSDIADRTLATIERSSQVLMSVISDVIEYSSLEAGGIVIEACPIRPAAVIAEVGAIVEPGATRAHLSLRVAAGHARDLEWMGDGRRIRQVLLNLAGNAVKFTIEGQVEISSQVVESPSGGLRRLYFAVKDSGPGIPADRLESIFSPFVQLETNRVLSQAGTGLGLSISRRVVELMGGSITVTSTVGVGSCFAFWIPDRAASKPGGVIGSC